MGDRGTHWMALLSLEAGVPRRGPGLGPGKRAGPWLIGHDPRPPTRYGAGLGPGSAGDLCCRAQARSAAMEPDLGTGKVDHDDRAPDLGPQAATEPGLEN